MGSAQPPTERTALPVMGRLPVRCSEARFGISLRDEALTNGILPPPPFLPDALKVSEAVLMEEKLFWSLCWKRGVTSNDATIDAGLR